MKKLLWFLILLCLPIAAFAQVEISERHGALYVDSITYDEVRELFASQGYIDFGHRELQIPRIYLKTLPVDWETIEKNDEKNKMFIRILLPLIMKVNEEIGMERNSVLNLWQKVKNGQKLNEDERQFVEQKSEEYDVFTRNKTDARYKLMLDELIIKVDELPPSFLLVLELDI